MPLKEKIENGKGYHLKRKEIDFIYRQKLLLEIYLLEQLRNLLAICQQQINDIV